MIRMSTSIIIIRLLICMVIFIPPCCISIDNWKLELISKRLNGEIQNIVKKIEDRYRSEDIILSDISNLTIGSPIHGQLIDSMPSKDGRSSSEIAEIIYEVSQSVMNTYSQEYSSSDLQFSKDLKMVNLTATTLGEMCMSEYYNNNSCIGKIFDYRRPDGSCNNLKRKYLGKANTPYKRLLFPAYRDGLYEMPNFDEEILPNPRSLSTSLVKDEDLPDNTKSMMMAYWTMFIGHDLSHTAVSTIGSEKRFVNCCDKKKNIQYDLNKNVRSCKPIFIPHEDKGFKPDHFNFMNCMNYVRSRLAASTDCSFGPMDQMNQATHYLDASMIYGTTDQQTLSLRKMSLGLLSVQPFKYHNPLMDKMTVDNTDTNVCQRGTGTCYKAGDIRANAFPPLMAVYTLWVREHNRIARELLKEKLFWTDEELFRETKKIVTACIQHITYNEWLPALLGVNYTKENGLGLEQRTKYDETADPTVSNSFATAILPFAYSMISDLTSLNFTTVFESDFNTYPSDTSNYYTIKKFYNRPLFLSEFRINDLLVGLTVQATQKVDMLFTKSVTNYLYSTDPNEFGMDIISLVIQRSRDHGIPSYTKFRKYCGLKDIENMQDLSEIMVEGSADRLLKLYTTWNDIDLFIGALLEKHVDDAMVGPTMRCIIREQFVRTRIADRYFYDVPGVFSDYQLENIKHVTLARVLCDNAEDGMMTLQPFLRPEDYVRSLYYCNSNYIPKMNLSGWFDKSQDNFFDTI